MAVKNSESALTEVAVATYVKLIRTAEAAHAQVSRGLAAEGVTASQFSTLKVLSIRGALAQRDIAKYLLKTGGNVTVVIDNLEKRGLVKRIRDTEDRRIVFVQVTPEGREIFERVYRPHLNRISDVMGGLDEEDCATLVALLEKVSGTGQEPLCMSASEAEASDRRAK